MIASSGDIADLSGVGPKTAVLLRELGIETPAALLEYLPFRYDDLRFPTPAVRLGETGGEENAVGRVIAVKEKRVRGLEIVELRLADDDGVPFSAKWIRRNRYSTDAFTKACAFSCADESSARSLVRPSTSSSMVRWRLANRIAASSFRLSRVEGSRKPQNRDGRQAKFRVTPRDRGADAICCRRRLRERSNYGSIEDAYRSIHAPATPDDAARARERFVFAEFLALATGARLAAASGSATTMRARCAFRPALG